MRPFDSRLIKQVPVTRAPVVALGMLGAASGVAAVGQAFVIAWLVVAVVRHQSVPAPAVAVCAVFTVRAILSGATEFVATWAGARTAGALRDRVIGRWLAAAADDRPDPATMVTVATHGSTSIEPYVARYLPALITAAVVPPLAIAALAWVDWPSALIVVLTVPLLPVFAALIGRYTQEATRRRWATQTRLAGHFLDVMRGLPTLVNYGRAERQADAVAQVGDRHRLATVRTLKIAFLSSAALELLATISVAIVAVWSGMRLAWGQLDLGVAITAILLAPEAYWPIRRVGQEFHSAADGAEALASLLDPVPAAARPTGAGRLTMRSVTYRYPGSMDAVIRDRSLSVGPGLTVLTGPSGAGKTTVLELLAGLRTPTDGTVERPVTHLVTQSPFVAAMSVRDNLILGAPTTDALLREALAATGFDRVVADLPTGLDTVLGDGGFGLSAGQRARLALTRAWLSDSEVILLDEPTAHLDPAAATELGAVIRRMAQHRPVLAVTHSAHLAALADQEIRLEQVVAA